MKGRLHYSNGMVTLSRGFFSMAFLIAFNAYLFPAQALHN
jgi:hypothetical protein